MSRHKAAIHTPVNSHHSVICSPSDGEDHGALTAEDVLARHLDGIGPAAVRASTKSRAVQGTAVYRILVGGSGSVEGKSGMVSEDHKLRFMMKFQRNDYRGEQFIFNDGKFEIAFANADQTRSPFADFVRTHEAILREGLFGGVLSMNWALLDVPGRKPKLTYEGLKKIEGPTTARNAIPATKVERSRNPALL